MRIIAGEFRGRKILPPDNDATRPITDRAKQSVFDILSPLLEDAVVYDLFSGTGSMGLECLSRGSGKAVFFEQDRSALHRLHQNILDMSLTSRTQIIPGDLFKWFEKNSPNSPADLVFLDPPYRFLTEQPEKLQSLAESWGRGFVSPNATVIFRHDTADQLTLPQLHLYDQRNYGSMAVEFLRFS
ncbi:MAG TPA: 16S rRNA (guanine(966)-N(2))-methyltransferase RsmD [Tepidisphaeraceae bacterium]|jgi:16S rRNA (guanine966-N2)-methyltransferase